MSHATPSPLPSDSTSTPTSRRSSPPRTSPWGLRAWLLGALISYAAAALWAFVVWPLQHVGGLFFYYYQGLGTTIGLFAPLVLLVVCVVARGRLRAVVVTIAFVDLLWQLLPKQSPYLRFEDSPVMGLHLLALALCAGVGILLLWPLVPPRRPAGSWDAMKIRRVGAAILATAGFVVFFGMAPSHTTSLADIDSIMLDDSLNQGRTAGAPQQAVVNGWTARDLLKVVATEAVESRDERPAALVGLGLLAMLLFIGTSGAMARTTVGSGRSTDPTLPADTRPMDAPSYGQAPPQSHGQRGESDPAYAYPANGASPWS